MSNRETALRLVREAIAEVNRMSDAGAEISPAEGTVLLGEGSALDSLAFVNLMVAVDSRVSEHTGREIALMDLIDADAASSPIRTVGMLADYVAGRL